MAGADQYQNSSSKRVNVKIFGRVPLSMKPVQLPSFMSIGTTVIELRVFNKKKKWTKCENPF